MINEKKTKESVNQLLEKFHNFRRLSGVPIEQVNYSSIDYSVITHLPSMAYFDAETLNLNLQRKYKAEIILKGILQTLDQLPEQSRRRIEQRYVLNSDIHEVCSKEMLSKTTYYRQLNLATIEFAELYNESELLVFNKRAEYYGS